MRLVGPAGGDREVGDDAGGDERLIHGRTDAKLPDNGGPDRRAGGESATITIITWSTSFARAVPSGVSAPIPVRPAGGVRASRSANAASPEPAAGPSSGHSQPDSPPAATSSALASDNQAASSAGVRRGPRARRFSSRPA